MGTSDGSIIATIITTHMPRNDAAAPGHVCPGIRIHAIDIVQPPGMGIPPIFDMDAHQAIVAVALAAKSSPEIAKKARWERCPEITTWGSAVRCICAARCLRPGLRLAVLVVIAVPESPSNPP